MPERDLPLKDYDHLPVGSLTTRIRTLGSDDLKTLLAYEQSHANRIQVVSAMQHRLSGLAEGAQPSGGDPRGRARAVRWVEGIRGDVRPAGEPAVPGRPDQPRTAEVAG